VVAVLVAMMGLLGWSVSAQESEPVAPTGQFQAVAPDLVLDTCTGKLKTAGGQVLEAGVDPSGTTIGKYSAAGYATAVTRTVSLNMLSQPVAQTDSVKGYIIVNTETGAIVKQRVYYRQPLQGNEF
jgi:hypothetical protein